MKTTNPTERSACDVASGSGWFRSLLGDIAWCLGVGAVLTAIVVPVWDVSLRNVGLYLAGNTIISLCIGMTTANLYRLVYAPLARRLRSIVAGILLHLGIALTSVLAGGELAMLILPVLGFKVQEMRPALYQIGFVVVVVLSGFSFAFERLRRHARSVELREHEARQHALRSQLEALQARTDPHFLFNTLNTVAGLIEEDPQTAERMLERLSGVFRYALTGSRRSWVRMEEELQAVRDYLAVEQIRFGERLTTSFSVAPGTETLLVPPLVLQPLVENAVLHGVAPRTDGGSIDIDVARSDGRLVLRVEDDGPGPGRSPHRGNGTSLDNLRERLRLVFQDRAELETGAGDEGGFRACIRLPVEAPAS